MADDPEPGPLYGALDKLTRPPLLTVLAWLQMLPILAVAVVFLSSHTGPVNADGEVITGDFMAFYTGATILHEGQGASMYDVAFQREVQDRITGQELQGYQPYLNPPGLAVLVSLTTSLSFVASFHLFCLAMAVGLFGGLARLRGVLSERVRGDSEFATLVLLVTCYHPLARTLIGGQNTPLTFGLLAATYAAVRSQHTVLAGILLGLLTYKPQYVPLIGLALLIRREWAVVGIGAAVGLGHYLLGALTIGWDWPVQMLAMLAEHQRLEMYYNAHTHFSLATFTEYSLPPWLGAPLRRVAIPLLALGALWRVRKIQIGDPTFPAAWALLVTVSMLISPHLQYYDAGVLVLPALLGLDTLWRQGTDPNLAVRLALAAAYVGYPAYTLSETLGFQPLFVVLVACTAWVWHLASSDSEITKSETT